MGTMTVKQFEKIISAPHEKAVRYPCGDCLYLQVGKAKFDGKRLVPGGASWLLRYEITRPDGKRGEKWPGLGSTKIYNLVEARERARKMRQSIDQGVPPPSKRAVRRERATETVMTVRGAAEARFNLIEAKWTSEKN